MHTAQTASAAAGMQVATPTAFPDSGTFGVTQRVTLLSATPGAAIHYTTDGSTPSANSVRFDPYVLPVLEAINDGDQGVTSTYTIKAIALKDGMAASKVATFNYTIARRATDVYLTKQLHPGIYQIIDFDDTKMMLIIGSERALLLDAGLGNGNLRAHVEALAGDLPLEVVISHGHPDHIAAMGQFQDHYDVYMNHRDLPMVQHFVEQMNFQIDLEQIEDLREGVVFDLGDRTLRVYEVPGHSAGHTVLFDEENGLLFASDAVGSNRPTITDSLWMQFPGMAPIDEYLSTLQVFRSKINVPIKESYGGHNDEIIYGETYLDNLQQAAQTLVDQGEAALVPSLRPTDVWQLVRGDRLNDPNWVAINVAKEGCLTVPADQIATLSNLQVRGATLMPGFTPGNLSYTATLTSDTAAIVPTATSSRYASLTINGESVTSGAVYAADVSSGSTTCTINVTAPNGSATQTYTLVITRAQA